MDGDFPKTRWNPDIAAAHSEAVLIAALTVRGYTVLMPLSKARYDLAVDDGHGNGIKTVQVKTARLVKGCVVFKTASVGRDGKWRSYKGEVDYFGVACPILGWDEGVFLVPVDDVPPSEAHLRIDQPKNGQITNIIWAKTYRL